MAKPLPDEVKPIERPAAPEYLDRDAAQIWDELFAALDYGFIGEQAYALTAAFCQHVAEAKRISALIDMHNEARTRPTSPDPDIAPLASDDPTANLDDWFKLHNKLLIARERETRAASALGNRLRIDNRSIRTADLSPATRASKDEPWNDTYDEE